MYGKAFLRFTDKIRKKLFSSLFCADFLAVHSDMIGAVHADIAFHPAKRIIRIFFFLSDYLTSYESLPVPIMDHGRNQNTSGLTDTRQINTLHLPRRTFSESKNCIGIAEINGQCLHSLNNLFCFFEFSRFCLIPCQPNDKINRSKENELIIFYQSCRKDHCHA
ncbi:MAG: hypothetical protein BWY58_01463 [Chloroflexi bacterium ADurb.Bin344]|nr:MAG: hypothetical protein BWY58_01463 [Chloroflexi bacterium ADurb.Bin344]